MPAEAIYCSACSWPLPPESWRQNEAVHCPGCSAVLRLTVFPAVARPTAQQTPEAIGGAAEASCYYHPENRAVAPCDECGRFLCALCELQVDGRRVCPGCLESGVKGKRLHLETERKLYDGIALSLSTLPVLLVWPAFIGAPMALYYCVRYWRAPGSIVPRTKLRFYLAAVFSLAEITFIVFAFWAALKVRR